MKATSEDLCTRFEQFDADNPRVFLLFMRFAREARAVGHRTFSADAICHRIRWETGVVTRDQSSDFKINDHYTAFYARKAMKLYPEFRGFFRLRESAADLAA